MPALTCLLERGVMQKVQPHVSIHAHGVAAGRTRVFYVETKVPFGVGGESHEVAWSHEKIDRGGN